MKDVEAARPFVEKAVALLNDLTDFTKLAQGLDDAEHRRASHAKLLTFVSTLKRFEGTLGKITRN